MHNDGGWRITSLRINDEDEPYPVLVDTRVEAALLREGNEQATALSRVSFMGTDGMRGKVTLGSIPETENCLEALIRYGLLTPEIISLAASAFSRLLLEKGILEVGDTVCVGNDGRDAATGWSMVRAMKDGFTKCGITVEDLGVVPTPFVPLYAEIRGLRVGAMLTASHNPSNQNGIKFFLDGKKILREGPLGDYALSAEMFLLKNRSEVGAPVSPVIGVDPTSEALAFLKKTVPAEGTAWMREQTIFLDTANGAYSASAQVYLAAEGISFVSVNDAPDGYNINRGCGVAEIEGTELFNGEVDEGANPITAAMFRHAATGADSYGIVLDGDGDRGFVLYCAAAEHRIYVLNGDVCGYLICEYLARRGAVSGGRAVFTVESDPMAISAVAERFGYDTDIVDVGDKWLCNYPGDDMVVGIESSGHVVLPQLIRTPSGPKTLRTGNGLLTALLTLTAISARAPDDRPFYRPYEPGFQATLYTYFIDKARFAAGSPLMQRDRDFLTEAIGKMEGLSCSQTAMQDRNMLHFSLFRDGKSIGSLFTRNSGTEDKNAVYLKCRKDMGELLLPLAERLRDIHREELRNPECPEFQCAERVVALLRKLGELSSNDLQSMLPGQPVQAVLYALFKEKRVYKARDAWRLQNT